MTSSGAADKSTLGETSKSTDDGRDPATTEPQAADTSVSKTPALFRTLEILRKSKNRLFNLQNSKFIKMLTSSEATEMKVHAIAGCLADFSQAEAQLLLDLLQLVVFLGQVPRYWIWNWVIAVRGKGLVPADYNVKGVGVLLGSRFASFFNLSDVKGPLKVTFVMASVWGRRLEEAMRTIRAAEKKPTCLKNWSPDQQKYLAISIAELVEKKRNPIKLSNAWHILFQESSLKTWLPGMNPTALWERQFPAVLYYLFNQQNFLSNEVKVIGQAVVRSSLGHPAPTAKPEEEDKVHSQTSTQAGDSQIVPVPSAEPLKVSTSTKISQASVALDPTLNQSGSQFGATPTATASSGGMSNPCSMNQTSIPTSTVNVPQKMVPRQHINNMNFNPVNDQKCSKVPRAQSLFLVPPPPLPSPLYLDSKFRPLPQQPVIPRMDIHCNNMVNNVDKTAPPLPEKPQVSQAPPAPSMVPDIMLEATTAGIIASLGCQEDLVNARLIEESLVERMQVGVLTDLGIADIHAMPCVQELERKQSLVNELLLSYFAVYPVVTLHDLRHHILKTFDIRDFRQLGLGPFSKQPMLVRYFKTIPAIRDILKIQESDVYVHLQFYLQEFYIAALHVTPTVSQDGFIQFLKEKYGVEDEHRLGIYFRDFVAAQQNFGKVFSKMKFHVLARNYGLKLRKAHRKGIEHAMQNLKVALFPRITHETSRDSDFIINEKFWDMDAAMLVERVFRKVEDVCAAMETGQDLLGDLSLTNAPYTSHVLREFFVHLEEEPWLHELFKLCICVGKSDENKTSKLSSLLDSPDCKSSHKNSACPDSPRGLKSVSGEVSGRESPFTMTCYREGQETIVDIITQCGLEHEAPEDKIETVEAVLLSHFFDQGVRSVEQLGEGGTRHLVDLVEKIQMPSDRTSIWYESAVCSNSRVVTYKGNVSNLGLGLLGSQETEEATSCLLNCPILEDMAEWSSWGLVFEPEFGSLRGFIRDNMTNISALETKPGTLLRIPLTASMKAFTTAIQKKNVSFACGQLVGLVVYHQGDKTMLLDELAVVMLQVLKEVNDADDAEETAKMVDAMLEGGGMEESPPSDNKRGIAHMVHGCLMKLPLLICELVAEKLFLSPLCSVLALGEAQVRELMSDLSCTIQERNKLCRLGLVLQYEEWYRLFIQRTEKMERAVDGPALEDDLVDDSQDTNAVQEPGNQSLNSRIDDILKGKHASIKLPSEDKMASYLELKKRDLEHEEGELDDSSAADLSDADDQEEKDADRLFVDTELETPAVIESSVGQAVETAGGPGARAKSTERVIGVADSLMDPCKAGALFFDDKWKDQSKHTLIMALVAIKHRWGESVNYSLQELKSNVQILTNNGFKSPVKSTIHFGPAYGCKVDFQKTFPGVEWNILDACYIEDFFANSSTKSWRDFFRELGVFDGLALQRKNTEMQREELESGPLSSCVPYLNSYESTKGTQYDYFRINDVICSDFVSLQVDLCKDEYDHMKALYQILSKDLDALKQHMTSSLCLCDIVDNVDMIKETDIKVETTVCRYLKKLEWIPVKQTNFVQFLKEGAFVGKEELRCAQIKDVYIRIPEIERILAHTVTYLDDDLDPDLAVLLGAKSTLTYHNVLEHFISWCCCDDPQSSEAKFTTSIQHIKKVYQYFKDNLSPEKLKAFSELPFVFVPDEFCDRDYMKVSGRFYHVSQVCLHDPLYILTNYSSIQESVKLTCLQPLEPHYDEFVSFFMDIAPVESMPRLKDYLTVIETMIGKNDDMKADIYIMFSIIGDQLSQLQAEELSYVENMLRKFLGPKKMFPTLCDKIVSLDDHPYVCYAGEVPESLMKTFSAMQDLHLIKVENITVSEPCVSMGNTKTFMSVCGIPDICQAITTKLVTDVPLRYLDAAVKRNAKWRARMIKAFLEKRHPDVAAPLKEKKTLLKIHDMKFYKVSTLNLVYGLKEKPDYQHVESLVFHCDKEQAVAYVLGDMSPEVNTEMNKFLADFLSNGEESVAADIRLFLKNVLPLLEELDLMFVKNVKEEDAPDPTSPQRKRKHKGDSKQALKKPKQEPDVRPLMDIVPKLSTTAGSLGEAVKSLKNPEELLAWRTSPYNRQSNAIGGVVGSQGGALGAYVGQVEHCGQFGTPIPQYYQGTNAFQMNALGNVNTSSSVGTSPSISQNAVNAIGESALKFVTAQLEYKDKNIPLSTSSSSLGSRFENSVEITPSPASTSQSDSVIGSDVLNFVKSQMVSKDKDSILTAAISKRASSMPVTSQTPQIPSASNDFACNVEQDPPYTNFLQAQQNIHMMIRGQYQKFPGNS